jgi:hypothetical protein
MTIRTDEREVETGRRVLAALAKGREKRNAQRKRDAIRLSALILDCAYEDIRSGKAPRGRAGRIARRLRRLRDAPSVSERHVLNILKSFTQRKEEPLSGISETARSNVDSRHTEGSENAESA